MVQIIKKPPEFKLIQIDKIHVTNLASRKRHAWTDIGELMESIKSVGILQPIIVREKGKKDEDSPYGEKPEKNETQVNDETTDENEDQTEYELISGIRRLGAAKGLQLEKIPAVILDVSDDRVAKQISLMENIQRHDLPFTDQTEALDELYESYRSVSQVTEVLGVYQPTVRDYLSLRILPDSLLEMMTDGKITVKEALTITLSCFYLYSTGQFDMINKIAEKYIELPTLQKRKFIEVIEDNPDIDIKNALKIAKKNSARREIIVRVPKKLDKSFTKVVEDLGIDDFSLISIILKDWLHSRGYLTNSPFQTEEG